jgi:hypothetical protein
MSDDLRIRVLQRSVELCDKKVEDEERNAPGGPSDESLEALIRAEDALKAARDAHALLTAPLTPQQPINVDANEIVVVPLQEEEPEVFETMAEIRAKTDELVPWRAVICTVLTEEQLNIVTQLDEHQCTTFSSGRCQGRTADVCSRDRDRLDQNDGELP